MRKFGKKITAALIVGIMAIMMCVPAFAAVGEVSNHETSLYKDGLFDPAVPTENLSMGDGAVLDTTYEELEDGRYYVTVFFAENFKAMGINSYLQNVQLDLDGDSSFEDEVLGQDYFLTSGSNNSDAVVGYSFYADSKPNPTTMYNAQFNIKASIMPINAQGDLIIF